MQGDGVVEEELRDHVSDRRPHHGKIPCADVEGGHGDDVDDETDAKTDRDRHEQFAGSVGPPRETEKDKRREDCLSVRVLLNSDATLTVRRAGYGERGEGAKAKAINDGREEQADRPHRLRADVPSDKHDHLRILKGGQEGPGVRDLLVRLASTGLLLETPDRQVPLDGGEDPSIVRVLRLMSASPGSLTHHDDCKDGA